MLFRSVADLTEREKLEIGDLYKDPRLPVHEIARAYDLRQEACVCYVIKTLGIPYRRTVSVHERRKYPEAKDAQPVLSIAEQIAQARQTLERLLLAQEQQQISF